MKRQRLSLETNFDQILIALALVHGVGLAVPAPAAPGGDNGRPAQPAPAPGSTFSPPGGQDTQFPRIDLPTVDPNTEGTVHTHLDRSNSILKAAVGDSNGLQVKINSPQQIINNWDVPQRLNNPIYQ